MRNRKRRKSVAALMMVAGGLAAAVPASNIALAQKSDEPSTAPDANVLPPESVKPQDTTKVQCNGFLPRGYEIACNALYLVGEDGTKTLAADGRWLTGDGKAYIVKNGVIVQQGEAEAGWPIPNPPQ
jgi:hypothetical protein